MLFYPDNLKKLSFANKKLLFLKIKVINHNSCNINSLYLLKIIITAPRYAIHFTQKQFN